MDSLTATSKEAALAAAAAPDGLIEVRLTAIRLVARDTSLFEFQSVDGKPLPAYEPGAHIDLHLPNGLLRNYSLTSAAPEPSTYTVGVKRDPASRGGSRFVHDELHVGTTIKIGGPRNNFRLREDAPQTVLFAGGIGITPIWCMVQRLNALGRDWRLHYACRSRDDMAFAHELEAMPQAALHYDDESGGFLDVAALVAAAPKDAHLYCCGPAPMLAAFEAATKEWPREQVHVEYFTAKELRAGEERRLHRRARALRRRVFHPGRRDHPQRAARCRRRHRLFLRARHLRRLRAARDLRHSGAPRLDPQRGGAGRQHPGDDLLRRLQDPTGWCWICERPRQAARFLSRRQEPRAVPCARRSSA